MSMETNPSNQGKKERWIQLGLLLILLICYTYFLPRWQDPNQNSRLDMVVAFVDDGTFQIDRYVKNTVDYAKVNGHYYSDKAPGTAVLGIPVYAALRKVMDLPVMSGLMERLNHNDALKATLRKDGSGLLEEKVRFALAQVALTFVASALPTALLCLLMFSLLGRFTSRYGPRLLVVLGYGLLTPAFAYAGAYYGHQLASACLFAAFYLLYMPQARVSTRALLGAGFLMGYSVFTEYPSALMVVILVVYAASRLGRNWKRLGWIILPGAAVAFALLAYNKVVFGSWFDLGYGHSELWMQEHSVGFMSLTLPHPEAIWGITFSPYRGLFLLSPLLLLALPGFWLWWRSKEYRAAFWVSLAITAAIFWFNVSSAMWWGGFAVGPRYALPMLPFLSLAIVFVFRQWGRETWLRILTGLLYGWSLAATWGLTLAEQAFPPDTIRNPLLEYALPNWQIGNIARNLGMFMRLPGVLSLIPLLLIILILLGLIGWLSRSTPEFSPKASRVEKQATPGSL